MCQISIGRQIRMKPQICNHPKSNLGSSPFLIRQASASRITLFWDIFSTDANAFDEIFCQISFDAM